MIIKFAENVRLQVDTTHQMRVDYADCQASYELPIDDLPDCDIFCNALCEMQVAG